MSDKSAIDKLSVWAVRYALPRSTYAVSDVVDSLIAERNALGVKSRAAIIRDIDKALANGTVLMAMDALEWGRLRDTLAETSTDIAVIIRDSEATR